MLGSGHGHIELSQVFFVLLLTSKLLLLLAWLGDQSSLAIGIPFKYRLIFAWERGMHTKGKNHHRVLKPLGFMDRHNFDSVVIRLHA